ESALKPLPVESRFAAAAVHDHPLMYAGRKMALAYPGHLFGHGLQWQEPERNLQLLMRGDAGWEMAAQSLQADYIFWGKREEKEFGGGPQEWRQSARSVASGKWGAIYRLNPEGVK